MRRDHLRNDLLDGALTGALSGALATAPMTVAMVAMHRALPPREKYPLPPSLITEELEQKAGVVEKIDRQEHRALTMVSHFGYGSLTGALFGLTVRGRAQRSTESVGAGVLFGLGVWTVSYLALLPALRLLRPATQAPPRRNLVMIAAHVVWGAALGLAVKVLR